MRGKLAEWRVWALRAGRSQMDRSLATYLTGMGQPLIIPHTMFVLVGEMTVVVDTSFSSVSEVRSAYPQEIWRADDEEPVVLLRELGISPLAVELVICTHLHYDHCGGNASFPNAQVIVQERELEYALAPTSQLMIREYFSPGWGFPATFDKDSLSLVRGDAEVSPGLRLLALPGHTPGSQGALVDTSHGVLALPGDLIMLYENFTETIPVGLHTDVDAWYSSCARLKAACDGVAPSHDMRLFGRDAIVELTDADDGASRSVWLRRGRG